MKTCPKCKASLPDTSTRCPECGHYMNISLPWFFLPVLILAAGGILSTLLIKPYQRITIPTQNNNPVRVVRTQPTRVPAVATATSVESYRSPEGTLIPYAPGVTTWQVLNPDLVTVETECLSCQISGLDYPDIPGHFEWQVDLPLGTPASVSMGWCAANRDILYANWKNMSHELRVDGYVIPNSALKLTKDESDANSPCWTWEGVILGWEVGTHTVSWVQTITTDINDGWGDYSAGVYDTTFLVTVN